MKRPVYVVEIWDRESIKGEMIYARVERWRLRPAGNSVFPRLPITFYTKTTIYTASLFRGAARKMSSTLQANC